jgi:hypothetical protein
MHDAGALRTPDFRQRLETMQQRVHERSGVPARARMNHHAGGLIDGDYIGVLMQDFDRQVFRLSVEWWRRGGIDFDRLETAQ